MPGPIVLDVLLIILLVAYAVYGYRRGFAMSAGGILGVVVGSVLAFFAIPLVTGWVGDSFWRLPAVLLTVLAVIVGCFALGTAVGRAIRSSMAKPIGVLDRLLGAVLSVLATAVVVSMLAFGLGTLGVPFLSAMIGASRVVSTIDAVTPEPVKAFEAQVRALVTQQGVPRLLEAIGVGPTLAVPDGDATAAQQQAVHSVVKIVGNAYACGQNQSGSGFVVAKDRVITNAHVVAGVNEPVVQTLDGENWAGRVVYFDPADDLAVIAVKGIPAASLSLGPTLGTGDQALVAGYPLGGPFSASPAAVQGVSTVSVPDIYGQNPSPREVYSLAADVQQGDSGGPLLDSEGRVAGVTFAKSATSSVGFALTVGEVAPVAQLAPSLSSTVASGYCTTG
ncbi:MarP family serine protease [soil metagenome]